MPRPSLDCSGSSCSTHPSSHRYPCYCSAPGSPPAGFSASPPPHAPLPPPLPPHGKLPLRSEPTCREWGRAPSRGRSWRRRWRGQRQTKPPLWSPHPPQQPPRRRKRCWWSCSPPMVGLTRWQGYQASSSERHLRWVAPRVPWHVQHLKRSDSVGLLSPWRAPPRCVLSLAPPCATGP